MTTTNSNLTSIIELITKILLHSVKNISYIIHIIAIYFNILLKYSYESFVEKLKQHKSKIKENITNYIKKITEELTKRKYNLNRLDQNIEKIESQITNFDKNYGKIYESDKYLRINSIIKDDFKGHAGPIYTILRTLVAYRNDLRTFKKNKPKLFNFINLLKSYSQEILKIEKSNSEKLSDYSRTADRTLQSLNDLKSYIDEFNKYIKKAKLQEISKHIKTMKSKSNEVQNSINQEFKKHIHSLHNIDFYYTEFEQLITKIKKFSEYFIKKFDNAKNAIALYNSLDSHTSKLTDVTFKKYDIKELITNSSEIKNKIKSFETINLSDNINTFRDSVSRDEYKDDIFSYKSVITYLLDEISVLIYIHHLLQIIILYTLKTSQIKNKINKITDIDSALKELPQIFKDLLIVYRVNNSSMNILIVFNFISFARFYINKNIYNFIMINYYTEVLIVSIYCYYLILSLLKFLQDVLKGISKLPELTSATGEIKILRAFTTNTNRYLQSIQCNIESLNTLGDNLSIDNLKYNLAKIRTTIDKITEQTNQVKNNIKFINKRTSELIIINFKIIYIKTYINIIIKKIISYTGYLYFYYILIIFIIEQRYTKKDLDLTALFESNSIFNIIGNLKKLEKLNQHDESVFKIIIGNFIINLVSVKNSINELSKIIETYINEISKTALRVECAIEGVARNFIRCSLQSLTSYLETPGNQNVTV